MIISLPNDGTGNLYHVVNGLGQTIHAYRDIKAARRNLEGQQRIFTQVESTKEWLNGPPTVHPDWLTPPL